MFIVVIVERLFRERLCVMESGMTAIQSARDELEVHRKSGEKRDRENGKLKSIIASQDERVCACGVCFLRERERERECVCV